MRRKRNNPTRRNSLRNKMRRWESWKLRDGLSLMSGLCPHTHKGIMTRRLIKKEKCLGKDKGGFLLFLHCTVSEIREKGMGRFWEEEEEEEKVSVKKRREREWESTNPESELQTLTAPWMRGCEVGSKAFPIAGFLELIIIVKDPLASSSSSSSSSSPSLSSKDGLWVWLNGWPTQPPLGWMGLQMPERPGLTIGCGSKLWAPFSFGLGFGSSMLPGENFGSKFNP